MEKKNKYEFAGSYYVYIHIRPDKDEIFYVGIGKKYKNRNPYFRAFSTDRSKYWHNLVKKLKSNYIVDIVYESDNLEEIKFIEIDLIAHIGKKVDNKGPLVNIADGGDGASGCKPSKKNRRAITKVLLGGKHTQEHKDKAAKSRSIPIVELDSEGNFIREWESVIQREKELGLKTHATIYKILKGVYKAPMDKIFIYKHDYDPIKQYSRCQGNCRTVLQLSLEGDFIKEWNSASKASKALDTNHTNIHQALVGKNKGNIHKGFKWEYKYYNNN